MLPVLSVGSCVVQPVHQGDLEEPLSVWPRACSPESPDISGRLLFAFF